MPQDVFDGLDGHSLPWSEPINGFSHAAVAPEPGIDLFVSLGRIENRIGALEGRITLQTLWRDHRGEAGQDTRLSDELLAAYEGIMAGYYDYRAWVLCQLWPEPGSPKRSL